MKTIVIAKFGGLDDEERKEVEIHALDIYKFFKFLNNASFDLVASKNIYGFKIVVDSLGYFLPFVKRNYKMIAKFDEDSSEIDDFLSEIGVLVLKEKNFNHNKDEASITAEDIERYSNLSRACSYVIEQSILCNVDPHNVLEFLKEHELLASFYNKYYHNR